MMKRSKDQKGMAMVSAIVLIAVIAIMASTLMQMSYLAYSRKVTERRTTETFYTAEAAVDTIKSYIQNTAASVLDEAKTGTADFAKAAYAKILGLANTDGLTVGTKIVAGADGSKPAALTALENLLKNKIFYKADGTTKKNDSAYYNGHVTTDIYDGIVTNGGDFSIGGIVIEKEGVRITDIHIKYINNEGYVAEITTDVVITAPTYAADITVPLGTYSMFAGNGGTMAPNTTGSYENNGASNLVYLHQEGNIYIGLKNQTGEAFMKRPTAALEIKSVAGNDNGANYFSIGGTNCVFNGDIYVDDGNTLIFTGGDGTEGANVQVRGCIYLSEGATLLLAPNVNLVCTNIMVDESGSGTYVAYKGDTVLEDNISQFFPLKETSVSTRLSDKTLYNTRFDNGSELSKNIPLDQAELLAEVMSGAGNSDFDDRAMGIRKHTSKCGVYILNADTNQTKGWINRMDDKYSLVKCIDNVFSCTAAGLYKNQIRCSEYDSLVDKEKLIVVPKVSYKSKLYDAEFATIINIPFLKLWETYSNSNLAASGNKAYTSYDPTDSSTYKTITFSEIENYSDFTVYGDTFMSNFYFSGVGGNINNSGDPFFGTRKLRIPIDRITTGTLYGGDYLKISTKKRDYTPADGGLGAGNIKGGGNVDTDNDTYGVYLSATKLQVRTKGGHYAGLFMSMDEVDIGQGAAVTRGISLIDMAKNTKTNPGLSNENNPVRVLLRKVAGAWIEKELSESSFTNGIVHEGDEGMAFNVFDNCFNGGVQIFWERTKSSSGGSGSSASDNSDVNFVDVDNWKKDAEPGAEETPAAAETGE